MAVFVWKICWLGFEVEKRQIRKNIAPKRKDEYMVNMHKKKRKKAKKLCKNLVKLQNYALMYKVHKNRVHFFFFFANCTKIKVYI